MLNIEEIVLKFIKDNGPCYTRDLYLHIGGRKSGLSLNKFRDLLFDLHKRGFVGYTGGKLPKWTP